ncbi:hypothetical protein [Microbacterium sp. NPDC091676]|uniref:hypothetical protein n=1 Tax=Microbacterium sp. NPDC091676 TaxID=3364212 RepID=UPI0037F4C02D
MKRKLWQSTAAVGIVALVTLGYGNAAQAAQHTETGTPSAPVAFVAFGSSSFEDVYNSMLQLNDADEVAEVLETIAAAEEPDLEALKLDQYSPEQATEILEAAAQSARDDTQRLSPLQGPSPYPVRGEPTNDNYSWVYSDRVEYVELEWGQWVPKAWIDFRVTTDPNDVNTASQWNATKGGDGRLSRFELFSNIWQDQFYIGQQISTWNVPGFGTQWNIHPQRPNDGHRFQAQYGMTVKLPNGEEVFGTWSTSQSRVCGEQTPGGFKCFFPAA